MDTSMGIQNKVILKKFDGAAVFSAATETGKAVVEKRFRL